MMKYLPRDDRGLLLRAAAAQSDIGIVRSARWRIIIQRYGAESLKCRLFGFFVALIGLDDLGGVVVGELQIVL